MGGVSAETGRTPAQGSRERRKHRGDHRLGGGERSNDDRTSGRPLVASLANILLSVVMFSYLLPCK